MNLLGLDIGSSSVKATIMDAESEESIASALYPKQEMEIVAEKVSWAKQNLQLYQKIHKILLPGDYIAMRLTGNINTTVLGLSEGIFWDFLNKNISNDVISYYGIASSIIPVITEELDLKPGSKIAYRAGAQLNNAFSLNVLNPGEIAVTAGTCGGVYGATIELYDTDCSLGAAKGAGVGIGLYKSFKEAFNSLEKLVIIESENTSIELGAAQHVEQIFTIKYTMSY